MLYTNRVSFDNTYPAAEGGISHPDFKTTVYRESGRLWKLTCLATGIASSVFSCANEKLRSMGEERVNFVTSSLRKWMDESSNVRSEHLNLAKKLDHSDNGIIKLPRSLVTATQAIASAKHLGHKAAGMLAAGSGVAPYVGKLQVPGFWDPLVPYSFEPSANNPLGRGSVTPTCHVTGKVGGAAHLMNAYLMMIDRQDRAVIRSGHISNKQYADDFVELVKKVVSELPEAQKNKPIRVVSQQLNNPENESKLIDQQHRWLIHANHRLGAEVGNIRLVHINTPSNRWFSYTRSLENMGMFGSLLQRLAPGKLFAGERLSREMNLDSWGVYVDWTLETDIMAMEPMDDALHDGLTERATKRKNLSLLIDQCIENPSQAKGQNTTLKELRKEMKALLIEDYHALGKIDAGSLEAKQLISLMRQVLDAQLEITGKRISRGKEGMLIQLLNERLGVHSAMNCKSGLDRTGLWHAVTLALASFVECDPFLLVDNWDETTALFNKMNCGLIGISSISKEMHKQMIFVELFRESVFQNLLSVGLPITQTSTGFMGFKWNSGFQENLLPLNFLPAFVEVEGEAAPVRLVNYDKNGEVLGITEWGRSLLTKFQDSRGT